MKINYFSDLFVAVMVVAWLVAIIVLLPICVYATITMQDTSVWSYLVELISVPLTAGGAIWMVKNSVQHAIANSRGEQAHMDFAKVDTEEIELETPVYTNQTESGSEEELG